jgi:predicted lipid-binding transport protein (Tim44 family)
VIEDRIANKLQLETIIESFDKVDIDSIDLLDRQATIAVRFRTSQVRLTRDESETIIDNPARISASIIDIWTFIHNIDADDPTWHLAATRTETNAY